MTHRARALDALTLLNGLVLFALPFAWQAPLLRTGFIPFLPDTPVSVFSVVQGLWESDLFLALLVGLLGMGLPLIKTLALGAVHLGRLGPRALPALEVLGKLSMADVFLLALAIVLAKGAGIGHVDPAWGIYLFTACTLGSMLISYLTARMLRRAA